LDGTNQTQRGGILSSFADLGNVGIASASLESYSNMLHQRSILWVKPWHQWIVVDDAKITDGKRHQLEVNWYVRGSVENNIDSVWQFSRIQNDDLLTIEFLPNTTAKYMEIRRQYSYEDYIVNATGAQMSVISLSKPVKLISSLTSSPSNNQIPKVTRMDSNSGTMITSQRDRVNWIWILPSSFSNSGVVSDYEITGTAGCILNKSNLLQTYCLMNGTSLSQAGITFVSSDQPIYLETSIENKKIIVEATADSLIRLYWPSNITKVLENGVSFPFSYNGTMLTVNLSVGRHALTIQP
jgi:hypothetical protein